MLTSNHASSRPTAIKQEMEHHRYFPSIDMSWDRTDNRICVSAPCTDNSFFAADPSHLTVGVQLIDVMPQLGALPTNHPDADPDASTSYSVHYLKEGPLFTTRYCYS